MKDDLKDICWSAAAIPVLLLGCVMAAIYAGVHWTVDGFMKLLEEI